VDVILKIKLKEGEATPTRRTKRGSIKTPVGKACHDLGWTEGRAAREVIK
jgi:hypothetical protein